MNIDAPADPPAGVWVNPQVSVGPSPIAGHGLFAIAPIEAGSPVLRLGGRLVTTAELESMFAAAADDPTATYIDTFSVVGDAHLVLPPSTAAHFCNHSCEPNLWMEGPYTIVSRRAVSIGDELTIDYGTISGAPGFEMKCSCGSTRCRGVVTSDDWLLPALQASYGQHWVPVLADRIRSIRW
ncbi:MAG: SET domain-containing protein-lysine N-methyltransferase [Actinobacteria bacterium]|nr:SET domain-containing protein-lysine N-methyltransferase [Actinomycetota bacterium]